MASTMICPGCQTSLRLRAGMAGKEIRCPRCGKVLIVPETADEAAEAPPTIPDSAAFSSPQAVSSRPGDFSLSNRRPCPSCGEPIAVTARQCRHCHVELEEEPAGVSAATHFLPCPRCGESGARRVLWTFWGSFYGPTLFTHVRCPGCGYTYNGRTGRSNLLPAIVFLTVPLLAILGLLGFIVWYLRSLGYF